MSLVLQETRVQVKYQSYENWTKKQMKKNYSLKFDRSLNRNSIYWDLRMKLDRNWICQDLRNQNFQIWFLAHIDMHVCVGFIFLQT